MSFSKTSNELSEYNYTMLEPEIRIVVQRRTSEIKSLMRRTASDTIEIGQKLIEVKEELEHGEFGKWLKAEFSWGLTTAWKLMKVAETFKSSHCEDLDITPSALYILTGTSIPGEARNEALERARAGETITFTKADALISKYKQSREVNTLVESVNESISAEIVDEHPKVTASESLPQTFENAPVSCNQDKLESPEQRNTLNQARSEFQYSPSIEEEVKQRQQQHIAVGEIYNSLVTNINYLAQENIFELIDIASLKALMHDITVLVQRKESSLSRQPNSNYNN